MVTTGTILTVLSNIPWGQVVDNAPKIADGATRLWGAVKGMRGKAGAEGDETDVAEAAAGAGTAGVADAAAPPPDAAARAEAQAQRLAGQVAALEAAVAELQTQLQASSGLIKDLADQNALLVQRLEQQHQALEQQRQQLAQQQRRQRQLAIALGVVGVLAGACALALALPGLRG